LSFGGFLVSTHRKCAELQASVRLDETLNPNAGAGYKRKFTSLFYTIFICLLPDTMLPGWMLLNKVGKY
jgi:hypothetical protein